MSQTASDRYGIEQEAAVPPSFGRSPVGPSVEQAESVAAWLGWHAVELAGVGAPLALALLVSAWLAVLAVPAAGLWAAHETRQRRARLRSGERGALTGPETTSGSDEENAR